jgi:hypothetical protein
MSPVRMLRANFEAVLQIALREQLKRDKESGIDKSIFAAGIEEVLAASKNGQHIYILEQ